FELLSNRFDATLGRSTGVQMNVVTKSGSNRWAGSTFGFFRDSRFIAKDFIVNRVLPYSNQQVGGTFGGPIKKDKIHFFVSNEYEREPRWFAFTSPFPRFNIPDLDETRVEKKTGARLDWQFSPSLRLTVRGNLFSNEGLLYPLGAPGATTHPSYGSLTS